MFRRAMSTVAATATLALGLATATAPPALAAGSVALTALGATVTESFDSLASAGTSNVVPTGWDFVETGTNANTTYTAGTGSSNTGDTYSFGTSPERAFGGLLSGSLVPTFGASFTNATGATITSLTVSYTGEMWRAGVASRGAADRLDFQRSTDATSLTTGTWTDVDTLDFSSPNISTTTAGALNGNVAPNRSVVSGTISGLNVPDGATVWIRWADFNISSSDDGLAVDDVAVTPGGSVTADTAPSVVSTVPADGATGVPPSQTLTVTFNEPVDVADPWFTLTCTAGGTIAAGVSGGPTTFTITPATNLPGGDQCTLTVDAAAVTDQDGSDPPDNMAVSFTTGFTVETDPCSLPYDPAYAIQGSGPSAALTGARTTQGVVVGDYEGSTSAFLRGFYLQDLAGDGDPSTSDAIFVFNGNLDSVALGDVVRVTGTAGEFQDQTQISAVTVIRKCGTGSVDPVDVTLPFSSATFLERHEGMLVRLPQTLTVTEHFQLGRFGQVVLSSGGRLRQPTNVVAPGVPAQTLQAQNSLNRIILDDSSQAQNPDPIVFARGGLPLSASNTLRGGDTAIGITGVMTYTWAGNAASGNAYRVRPVNALGGTAVFTAANARPSAAPEVGGTVRVVGMNLLNFFNTLADGDAGTPGCFPSGTDADCRGANSAAELARQLPKTVAAILATDPDVLAVNEIENDGYGPTSSLQLLVDQLNATAGPGAYAFVDVDARSGQVNAMGADAIRVALIYQPAVVTPVGVTAPLNTTAFVNGGDPAPRNRATVAQAFEVVDTGAVFVVTPNHLKSKGSACSAPDAGDGQGNCNQVRVNAVTALLQWLATDPTGTGDPDVLVIGDLNSYAQEDPVTTLRNAGFTNLVEAFVGPDAYSYVFDGQWGYLDHALASASLAGQVAGVAEYHINADEPSVLDYNLEFKSAGLQASLYAPNELRVSDHDPLLVGLTPNARPTVAPGGPYTVAEGGSITLAATGTDPNGDPLTYEWDLDGDSVFETSGASVTFGAAALDGPSVRSVAVRATDPGGLSATATTTVTVTNVAPTVSASFASASVDCGPVNATFTVTFSDPGVADTHTAVVSWGDGNVETVTGATSPLVRTHTYALAGTYTASVTVTDDDGGADTATATTAVRYATGGLLPPVHDGAVFKHGSIIPVKVTFTDCDGRVPTDLAPTIRVDVVGGPSITDPPSASAADTPGVLRFSDGQWTYTLATGALPHPNGRYRIVITVPATGQEVIATIRLRQ